MKENFHAEYQGSLGRLETSVEEEHINNLKHSCYREKNYSECCGGSCATGPDSNVCLHLHFICVSAEDSMMARARNFNDRELHRRAQSMATPACDNLQKLQNQ